VLEKGCESDPIKFMIGGLMFWLGTMIGSLRASLPNVDRLLPKLCMILVLSKKFHI
jgi:hypothetical protein